MLDGDHKGIVNASLRVVDAVAKKVGLANWAWREVRPERPHYAFVMHEVDRGRLRVPSPISNVVIPRPATDTVEPGTPYKRARLPVVLRVTEEPRGHDPLGDMRGLVRFRMVSAYQGRVRSALRLAGDMGDRLARHFGFDPDMGFFLPDRYGGPLIARDLPEDAARLLGRASGLPNAVKILVDRVGLDPKHVEQDPAVVWDEVFGS